MTKTVAAAPAIAAASLAKTSGAVIATNIEPGKCASQALTRGVSAAHAPRLRQVSVCENPLSRPRNRRFFIMLHFFDILQIWSERRYELRKVRAVSKSFFVTLD